MKSTEIVEVVGMLALAFDRHVPEDGSLFEVYEEALGDLDLEDPRGDARRLLKTLKKWPAPALLREALLGLHGALPLEEDRAWAIAAAFSSGQADEAPADVLEAIRNVGGTWSLAHGEQTTVRAQFRDAYRQVRERALSEILGASLKGVPLGPGTQLQLRHAGRALDRGRGERGPGPGEGGPPGPSPARRGEVPTSPQGEPRSVDLGTLRGLTKTAPSLDD